MRTAWIDNAKGLVIITVVAAHVGIGLARVNLDLHPGFGQTLYNMAANSATQAFFFFAGLFVEHSLRKRGKTQFILNKVETIVYPYIVFSLIQGGVELAFSKYTNMSISISEVLSLFFMPRAQFWYLYAFFLCLVVIAIFYSERFRTRDILLGFALTAAVYLATTKWYSPIQAAFVTNNIVYIAAGMAYARFTNLAIRPVIVVAVSLFTVAVNYWASTHTEYLEYRSVSLIIGLGSIFVASGLGALVSKTRISLFDYLGKMSMQIYVLHIFACAGTRIVLRNILGTNSWPIHFIAGTILGVVFPIIAYRAAMKHGFKFLFICPINLSNRNGTRSDK